MKRLLLLLLFWIAGVASAQVAVSGTVTDPDTIVWANGNATFTLHNNTGIPPKLNGIPMTPAQLTVVAPLNGSGAFSTSLSDNTHITPIGTQWAYQICPAATSPCQNFPLFTASGASINLTTAISATIQPIRIPASYTTQAYADVEISPLPPPGGTYYNLQGSAIRFWNGTVWAALGAGGGGGGTPNAPVNSIQTANAALNGFNSDAAFTINSGTHTLLSTANMIINTLSVIPSNTYDPVDTRFNGGLAAAIAGTSGFTPTQVIQAAIDYGECQFQTHAVSSGQIRIPLPSMTMNIGQILLWPGVDIGGNSMTNEPAFQHNDATKAMIINHGGSDVINCSGTNYTPGGPGDDFVHNIAVAGMGNVAPGDQDIAIWFTGGANVAWQITGYGNGFGSQVILVQGTNNFMFYMGYPGAQLKGCGAYRDGNRPVSGSVTSGSCSAVQDASTDSEGAFFYASDNGALSPGLCYPNCSAMSTGNNFQGDHLFLQRSDVNLIVSGTNNRLSVIRADASYYEAVRLANSGEILNNVQDGGSCLSTTLQANYNANIKTGCANVVDNGQGNQILGLQGSLGSGFFGQGYNECIISSSVNGSSSVGGTYGFVDYRGNPDSTSINDRAFCGAFDGGQASGRVMFPMMGEMTATTATVNVSNINFIFLSGTVPVTNITAGVAGQEVSFEGVVGASVVPGAVGGETIATCTGSPEVFDGSKIVKFKNAGGYSNGTNTPNNQWREICNAPQLTPLHVNWTGNPTPSNPSMIDLYGNMMFRQQANLVLDVSQIHGTTLPGTPSCFVERVTYSDLSYTMSNTACTNIDLTHQTSGAVFSAASPQAVAYDLFLVSTPTTVPVGKYPPPVTTPNIYWDGTTTIAAGGDGSVAPAANLNYTGMPSFPWGALYTTFNNTQPPCDVLTRGRMWLIGGTSGNPDVLQNCIQQGVGVYGWVTVGGTGSVTTGVLAMGTSGGALTNSHVNETANAGYDTFTQGIVIQDTSGNGANAVGAVGTKPSTSSGCGVAGNNCWWSDSTQNAWDIDNNGTGTATIVSEPVSAPVTVGHCLQKGAGSTITDAGAACGSGGTTPGTPTVVADTGGAGTGATSSFVTGAGSSDFSGFVNITTGTCSGGVCGAPSLGVFTVTFSRTYTPQLKCFVQAANLAAMALANNGQVFSPFTHQFTNKFDAISNAVGLPQSTAFIYYYHCDFQ